MKFRRKPIVVEARQFTIDNPEEMEMWTQGSLRGLRLPREQWVLQFATVDGDKRAVIGDWLICCGMLFDCCSADYFEMNYDAIDKDAES